MRPPLRKRDLNIFTAGPSNPSNRYISNKRKRGNSAESIIEPPPTRKNANKMENTRHRNEVESIYERRLRKQKDKRTRHEREVARLKRRGVTPPKSLTPIPSPQQPEAVCEGV